MPRKSLTLFTSILICLCLLGCGDDNDFVATTAGGVSGATNVEDGGADADSDKLTESIRQIDARVILPVGMTFDSFLGSTAMSQLTSSEVGPEGEILVSLKDGGRVLVIFFDSADEPVLVGFVTDEQRQISLETTVQASIYVGLGTVLLPEDIRQNFWNEVKSFPGYDQLVADTETLFRNDPLFFGSAAYRDLISVYIAELVASESVINSRLVTDGAVKSGLQIKELGGDAVVIANTTRRRAHAFVYKLDFTTSNDVKTTLIDESEFQGGQPVSSEDVKVNPTTAITSTIGAFQGVASGKGIDYAVKDSDMIDLSLGLSEKEAHYSIRVIGPSPQDRYLTDVEHDKLTRLRLETLGIDFVMPMILLAIGQDDYAERYLPTFAADESFLNALKLLVAAVPSAEESLGKSDFKSAVTEIFQSVQDGLLAQRFTSLLEHFFNGISFAGDAAGAGFTQDQSQKIIGRTESLFKALKAVDYMLQAADWGRILAAYNTTNRLEDFRITVTENKISLLPPEATAIQGLAKSIEAIIQDGSTTIGDGEAFEYRWSTTGNYGTLRDDIGHNGTSFSSSRDNVEYVADLGAIPDDAFDEITVEIVIVGPNGEVPVGTETARFFVRPFGFEIFPDNVEMMGGTSLPIKVVLTDGSDPFESVVYDYSMVWETSGEFGLFNGVSKDLTEDTKNSALYEALEEESEGVEAVSVAIYSKLKGETGPVFFEDRINGSIRITNDENKKIFYIANKPISGGNSTQFWINWFVHTVFEFPPVPGAESYKMTIVEHNPLSSFNGATDSWTAGNPNDLTDGSYRLTTARTSGSVPTDLPDASERASNGIANALAYHSTISGLAKVVVTLMP